MKVDKIVVALLELFPDRPDGFRYDGQDFRERAEAWAMHAVEQLEDEIDAWKDDPSGCAGDDEDWDETAQEEGDDE